MVRDAMQTSAEHTRSKSIAVAYEGGMILVAAAD